METSALILLQVVSSMILVLLMCTPFFCHITTGGFNFLHLQQPTSAKTANVNVN